jgi:hypothetical protein
LANEQRSESATFTAVLRTALKAVGVPAIAWLLGVTWQSVGDYAKNHPWQAIALCVF